MTKTIKKYVRRSNAGSHHSLRLKRMVRVASIWEFTGVLTKGLQERTSSLTMRSGLDTTVDWVLNSGKSQYRTR